LFMDDIGGAQSGPKVNRSADTTKYLIFFKKNQMQTLRAHKQLKKEKLR